MKDEEKHGILIFDEISLRESIEVNSNCLTYSGLEDFGRDADIQHYGEKANHGLVFMFQSLHSNFSQSIAVFTSKGNVKGYNLNLIGTCALVLIGVVFSWFKQKYHILGIMYHKTHFISLFLL